MTCVGWLWLTVGVLWAGLVSLVAALWGLTKRLEGLEAALTLHETTTDGRLSFVEGACRRYDKLLGGRRPTR